MQHDKENLLIFKLAVGRVLRKIREMEPYISMTRFALEYDLDKGSMSKLERGIYDCRLSTAWKIAEAKGIDFCVFAKMLQDELGSDFKFMDE